MDFITNLFHKKINQVQTQLLKLLEQPVTHSAEDIINLDPLLVQDFNQIQINLPNDHIEKVIQFFSRLAFHFDLGILLQNKDFGWYSQSLFLNKKIQIFEESLRKKKFHFNHLVIHEIHKTQGLPILKKLNLEFSISHHDINCFRIQLTPDFVILIFSNKPDLFLKDQMYQLHQIIEQAFPK